MKNRDNPISLGIFLLYGAFSFALGVFMGIVVY